MAPKKSRMINIRVDRFEHGKLERLSHQTGMNVSEVLRALVANAELAPVTKIEPVATLQAAQRETATA